MDYPEIIYEDDDLLVIDKPAGQLSVAADNQRRRYREGGAADRTAFALMRQYVKRRNPRADLYILHRLDRDTSGVLAFAKNPAVQEALRDNWNNLVRRRQYVAVLRGTLTPPEGVVKSYLAEDRQYNVYSTPDASKGKLAITSYKTLQTGNGFTLAEMNLSTGRKNQIRVHMADLRHPVVGDTRYGGKTSPVGRMCLHAQTLALVHPFERRLLTFTAPAPDSFQTLISNKK